MIDLKAIETSRAVRPPRSLIYGPHGIGKTTFGASAPNPIFILTEDGLGTIDVPSFPLAGTLGDVQQALAALEHAPQYQTVVLDSCDWLDSLIWQNVNTKNKPSELAYGRGAVLAADLWMNILNQLQLLRDGGKSIVLLAHAEIKRFDSPEVEPYDRYQPKMQARSSALVQEWCDVVAFCNHRVTVKSTDVGFGNVVTRGVSSGERLMHLTERPAFLAKNRYGLPDSLPLSWPAFQNALGVE